MSVRDELDELQVATKTINSQQWVTGCGLVLPDRMTAKDHEALAIHLGTMSDASQWGRGDQMNRIREELAKQYGKKTDK
jgi:hypothetical protein